MFLHTKQERNHVISFANKKFVHSFDDKRYYVSQYISRAYNHPDLKEAKFMEEEGEELTETDLWRRKRQLWGPMHLTEEN